MLRIEFLGKTRLLHDGKDITGSFGKKTIALLFLLVVSETKCVPKEKLAFYLWPDSNDDAARYNVRYNIWMLSKNIPKDELGREFIFSDKSTCGISEDYEYTCDLMSILSCNPKKGTIEWLSETVTNAFGGGVMEGWYLKGCNEFNELVLFHRMHVEQKQLKILMHLAKAYEKKKIFEKALATYISAEQFDPNNEKLAAAILNIYINRGDRVSAVKYYKEFEERLWKDINITPNETLQNLYLSILEADKEAHFSDLNSCTNVPIKIQGIGIKSIEWSLINNILHNLFQNVSYASFEGFCGHFSSDISYIHKGILTIHEKFGNPLSPSFYHVPKIRIVEALCALFDHLSKNQKIILCIDKPESADDLSKDVLLYMETVCTGLEIQCEKLFKNC